MYMWMLNRPSSRPPSANDTAIRRRNLETNW